jgi:hypothetical protein
MRGRGMLGQRNQERWRAAGTAFFIPLPFIPLPLLRAPSRRRSKLDLSRLAAPLFRLTERVPGGIIPA